MKKNSEEKNLLNANNPLKFLQVPCVERFLECEDYNRQSRCRNSRSSNGSRQGV